MLSIIIPCHNGAHYVHRTLESAVSCKEVSEIVVIDDGSTDESRSIIEAFDDARVRYFYQEQSGVSAARNNGLGRVSGDFVMFLDSDDLLDSNGLARMISLLNENKKCDVALGKYIRIDENDLRITSQDTDDSSSVVSSDKALYTFFGSYKDYHVSSMVWRLERVKKLRFSTVLAFAEDQDFFIRALAESHSAVLFSGVLLLYRLHGRSALRKPYDMRRASNIVVFLENIYGYLKGGMIQQSTPLSDYRVAMYLMEFNSAAKSVGSEKKEALNYLSQNANLKDVSVENLKLHHRIMLFSSQKLPLALYPFILKAILCSYNVKPLIKMARSLGKR